MQLTQLIRFCKLICLLLGCFLASTRAAWSQNDSLTYKQNPWVIGLRMHYGYTITHSERLAAITQGNPYGIELHFSRHLNTLQAWEACHCYPRVGAMLQYTNFDYPRVLGSAVSAIAFAEPFFAHQARLMPSIRIGGGLSYLTHIHDPESNPDNLLFSLPVSFYIFVSAGLTYQLNPNLNLNLQGGFPHISNGSIRQPNAGINYPSLSFGVEYKPQAVFFAKRTKTPLSPEDKKQWHITLFSFASYKETREKKRLGVYGSMLTAGKILNRIQALDVGIEYIEDRSMRENLRTADTLAHSNHRGVGISLGHSIRLGRFHCGQRIGMYALRPSLAMDRIYHRSSVDYHINSRLLVGVSLKAHRNIADFIQFQVGHKWATKK
jgi:hypothetical protein